YLFITNDRDAFATVLVNKWTVRDILNRDQYTTRIYHGRLRVSTGEVSPHVFRGQCLPPLVPGMMRDSMEFEVSEDGLTLAYTVIDRETAYAAPEPATSWEIVHTEQTADDKIIEGSISVTLRGNRNAEKLHLIQLG